METPHERPQGVRRPTPSPQANSTETINYLGYFDYELSEVTPSNASLDERSFMTSSIVNNNLPNTTRNDKAEAPLLQKHRTGGTLTNWPTFPRTIHTVRYIIVLNFLFDVLLVACSTSFLLFASLVLAHNEYATAEYPRTTQAFINATKYVRMPRYSHERKEG